MKKKTAGVLCAAVLVLGSGGAIRYLSPGPGNPDHQDVPGEPVAATPIAAAQLTEPTGDDSDHSRPETAMGAAASREDGTEVVLGIRVRKDRNCTVQLHYIEAEDGTVKEAYSCEPHVRAAQRPYQDYDIQTLAQLAYGDPTAAEELGRRVAESDPALALEMMIRASALSGDASPVVWLAQVSYSVVSVNDVPRVESMKTSYVLNELAHRMGHGSADPSQWRLHLQEADVSGTEIDGLDRAVDGLLSRMREIQLNVTGGTTPGGDSSG